MNPKKKGSADFRYDTGPARIPWAAVGEPIRQDDVLELLQFLLPPQEGRQRQYGAQFARVAKEIGRLALSGKPAGKLTLGGQVQALENEAKRLLGARHALFVTSATAGFEIAYQFAGLRRGDEVIAPANTFIATIAYPLAVGAKVVLADSDPRTGNMDPRDVERKLTKRTKVIIPVHLGGYPVDMDPIMALARRRGIVVIEDAAHGFGGSYRGRMLGTIGHFGAFSFHEVKNVTALGEGGILVTNQACGADFVKSRFLGLDLSRQIPHWLYDVVALRSRRGWFAAGNHSATEIQALCLRLQLKRLKGIIAQRKAAEEYLTRRFARVPGLIPPPGDSARIKTTHHLYLLQVDPARAGGDSQQLKAKLNAKGVVNIPHYGPLYKFSILRQLGYDTNKIQRSCPVTEEMFQHRFTHLPLYDFSAADLRFLADTVIAAVAELQTGK